MSVKKAHFGILVMAACVSLSGQNKDSLTLPHEVGLNQRQPPDLVLKTIGLRPGDRDLGRAGSRTGIRRPDVQIL